MDKENEQLLQYYILQYALDEYYIGIMDYNKLNNNNYAFELIQPLSITRYENKYIITALNFGLGDSNHVLYINKDKVISVFTPTDEIIQSYCNGINKEIINGANTEDSFFQVGDNIQ